MAPNNKPKRVMTEAHKKAIVSARNEARTVEMYLLVLRDTAPKKRGRAKSQADMQKELALIESKLRSKKLSPLEELKLMQKQTDLRSRITSNESVTVLKDLEKAFVKVGASYSKRHGITAQSWKKVGVPASVLSTAGIK